MGTSDLKFEYHPEAVAEATAAYLWHAERGEQIIGVAVAHLHRRPGYWRKRLAP